MSDIYNLAQRLGISSTEAAAKLGYGGYGMAGSDPLYTRDHYMDNARRIASRTGCTIDEAISIAKGDTK